MSTSSLGHSCGPSEVCSATEDDGGRSRSQSTIPAVEPGRAAQHREVVSRASCEFVDVWLKPGTQMRRNLQGTTSVDNYLLDALSQDNNFYTFLVVEKRVSVEREAKKGKQIDFLH
ncbi:CDC42 small effector protein 2 isoform X1 [Phoca vitulina]|uniref:CDC42 small effector protein 2 isoform X1 n=1 Tax=Phoca vitulina TaxID=9720 RepID=UPI0013961F6F|nr:CDC42 small effector protein 2 isoform X1 [Phoca vitulina]